MRKKLEPGVHLEFYERGCTHDSVVPPLAKGDRLHLHFADSKATGMVIQSDENGAVIKVLGVARSIRRAAPPEKQLQSPRGMSTVEWIVDA